MNYNIPVLRDRSEIAYETGRVIVTDGLGVTEGFKNGIGLYDLIFKISLLDVGVFLLRRGADGGEVRDYLLRVLSLTGTRLATVHRDALFRRLFTCFFFDFLT
jgi:hypothetical protein